MNIHIFKTLLRRIEKNNLINILMFNTCNKHVQCSMFNDPMSDFNFN